MKTIVFAYHDFGCVGIEALLAAGYDIAAVFTHHDNPQENVYFRSVAKLCANKGIPAYVPDQIDHPLWKKRIADLNPDFIFSFYYRDLIPGSILGLAKKGAFNLHGSLLPRYRGRAPLNWALVNGEDCTGLTLHYMVDKADAGDIVGQGKVLIEDADTALTLQEKMTAAAASLLKEQLPLIATGKASRTAQDDSKATYFGRRTPADGYIDWNQPARNVRNLIRAVTLPYPGAFTYAGDRKVIVWEAKLTAGAANKEPGTVLSESPLTIACADGALTIAAGQIEDGIYLSGAQLAGELNLVAGL